MSNENTPTPVSVQERTELFKQVAVAVLSSRPAVVLKGVPEGKKLSQQFVEEVALITESILAEAKTFGEK